MQIVFVSNYYNHHQAELSAALYRRLQGDYYFVETMPMEEERKALGWGNIDIPSYVKSFSSEEQLCRRLIDSADVVIVGSAPDALLQDREKNGKLIFKYSERLYKKRGSLWQLPLRAIRYHRSYYASKNSVLLCASAYAAHDYARTGLFRDKAFQWGYFPQFVQYDDITALISSKRTNSIIWVARMIDWKHPEIPLAVAKRLKAEGYSFTLRMIGNGSLYDKIFKMIQAENLEDCVSLLGAMSPQQVRKHMEESEVFLFTSDRNEGWGAVLNEAMNAGCAVVASHAIGAAPFLIQHGQNGLLYRDGDQDDLYNKVKTLLNDRRRRCIISANAYHTIANEWNAEIAAERVIELAEHRLKGEFSWRAESGICAEAKRLDSNWFQE